MEGFSEKQKIKHVKKLWKFSINMTKIAFKSIKVFNEISKDFAVQTDGDFTR
jgi:hypothetical protein